MKIKLGISINSIIAKMLPVFNNKVSQILNTLLEKKEIAAKIDKIDFVNVEGRNVEAMVTVNNVDYSGIIIKYLPVVLNKVRSDDSVLFKVLDLLKDDRKTIIKSVIDAVDDKKKEQIIALLVDAYDKKICSELAEMTKLDIKSIAVVQN